MDALARPTPTDDPGERERALPYSILCSVGRSILGSIFRFEGLERLVTGLCELDGAREQALSVGR